MSALNRVTKGKIKKNLFAILHGPDGVGKTSFGAAWPNAIFLDREDGSSNLDVTRLPKPEFFDDIKSYVTELTNETHSYKTLVIDTLDWCEGLLWAQICQNYGVDSIEKVLGGYGKGFTIALDEWGKLIQQLQKLREKMHILVLAHSIIKPFNDPQTSVAYDRYQLKLNDKASAKWREAVEAVLFANYEVYAKKEGTKSVAFGNGRRLIFTERQPAYDAKNRYGLPPSLPLSWPDFLKAYESGEPERPEALLETINSLIKNVTDEEMKKKIIATTGENKTNAVVLSQIVDRMRAILGG